MIGICYGLWLVTSYLGILFSVVNSGLECIVSNVVLEETDDLFYVFVTEAGIELVDELGGQLFVKDDLFVFEGLGNLFVFSVCLHKIDHFLE